MVKYSIYFRLLYPRARKDMVVPLSIPIKGNDGAEVREIHIPNGTGIVIGVVGTNSNPEIWGDDAYEWKPDRWLSPLPDTVIQAHYPGIYSNMSVVTRRPT